MNNQKVFFLFLGMSSFCSIVSQTTISSILTELTKTIQNLTKSISHSGSAFSISQDVLKKEEISFEINKARASIIEGIRLIRVTINGLKNQEEPELSQSISSVDALIKNTLENIKKAESLSDNIKNFNQKKEFKDFLTIHKEAVVSLQKEREEFFKNLSPLSEAQTTVVFQSTLDTYHQVRQEIDEIEKDTTRPWAAKVKEYENTNKKIQELIEKISSAQKTIEALKDFPQKSEWLHKLAEQKLLAQEEESITRLLSTPNIRDAQEASILSEISILRSLLEEVYSKFNTPYTNLEIEQKELSFLLSKLGTIFQKIKNLEKEVTNLKEPTAIQAVTTFLQTQKKFIGKRIADIIIEKRDYSVDSIDSLMSSVLNNESDLSQEKFLEKINLTLQYLDNLNESIQFISDNTFQAEVKTKLVDGKEAIMTIKIHLEIKLLEDAIEQLVDQVRENSDPEEAKELIQKLFKLITQSHQQLEEIKKQSASFSEVSNKNTVETLVKSAQELLQNTTNFAQEISADLENYLATFEPQ